MAQLMSHTVCIWQESWCDLYGFYLHLQLHLGLRLRILHASSKAILTVGLYFQYNLCAMKDHRKRYNRFGEAAR